MKAIYKALAEFQQTCPVIYKDSTAGSGNFKYNYADLPTILSIVNPLLKAQGLGFTQLLNGTTITTVLFHVESGDTITSSTEIPQVELRGMNPFQSAGSGITYYRRYALSSLLGIVTDKDTEATGEAEKKGKPALPDERFKKSLELIKKGEYNKESLISNFELTKEQTKELNSL